MGIAWIGVIGIFYSLWWTRDRVLYLGASPHEQRLSLFQRAGLKTDLLSTTEQAAKIWPLNVRYHLISDVNTSSYLRYLMAPRLTWDPEDPPFEYSLMAPIASSDSDKGVSAITPFNQVVPVLGFIASLIVVFGVGGFVGYFIPLAHRLTVPELFATGIFVVMSHVCMFRWAGASLHACGCLLIFMAVVGLMSLWRQHGKGVSMACASHPGWGMKKTRDDFLFCSLGLLCALGLLTAFLMAVVVVPDDWDAWAIWGSKAKVLASDSTPFSSVTAFGHADYPLMWPSVWAFTAWASGGWEEQWVKAWPVVCMALAGYQMYVTLRFHACKKYYALLPVACWLTVPKALVVSSWGYAEPMLWLFMVCGFCRAIEFSRGKPAINAVWAMLFGIGAAYVKNEGVLFSCLLLVWLCWQSSGKIRLKILVVSLILFGLYAPWWMWVRMDLHLGSHALEGLTIHRLPAVVSRVVPGLKLIGGIWMDLQQWGIVLFLVGITSIYLLVQSFNACVRNLFLPGMFIGALFAIVVAHEAELSWQVSTSWDRLTLQVLPLWILGVANGILGIHGSRRVSDESPR